jgi:hypothetical protein
MTTDERMLAAIEAGADHLRPCPEHAALGLPFCYCDPRCWAGLTVLPRNLAGTPEPEPDHHPQAQISAPPDPVRQKRHAEAVAYVASYTGKFGLILDLQAHRAFGTKWFSLSDRQIEVVLASRDREAAWAKEREERRAFTVAAAIASPERPAITDGLYRSPDGAVFKVQKAVHGSGNLYAKRLEVDPESRTGTFVYEPGAIRRIDPAWRMTKEDAIAFGALYGCCCACGRTLTDEKSIEAGIGPVCGRKFA